MLLDLRELIANPVVRKPFRLELEEDRLDFPAVKAYLDKRNGSGRGSGRRGRRPR